MINPYETLGVPKDAKVADIKKAYRTLSKKAHPDAGGDPQEWAKLQLSYDVLVDADRRKRYNATGRLDVSRITPARVRTFLETTFRTVITAQRKDGTTDDPTTVNIRNVLIANLQTTRELIANHKFETQRKIERATRIKENFELRNEDADDMVGAILQHEIDVLNDEMKQHEDALELSLESEAVLRMYEYKAALSTEGLYASRAATSRGRSGGSVMAVGICDPLPPQDPFRGRGPWR